MSATGFLPRSSAAEEEWPTSSEYTRASRTRRAISCEYWPPRSTTSTGRSPGASSGVGNGRTSAPIVGRLLRDRHVVRVALLEACRRDPDEPGLGLHLVDGRRAAVAHRLPHSADELVDDRLHRALVGHATLDPLGDELLDVLDVALEVAVLRERAGLHRAERAHASVLLEPFALDEDDVAGRLVGAREHRAEHDRVGAGRNRLRHVAGVADPAVGDQRDTGGPAGARALVDGGDLRHTHAGHDSRSARAARPDT